MNDRLLHLLNRQFMYALLARAFCEEPDKTFIDVVESEHTECEFKLASTGASCDLMDLLAGIRTFIPETTSNDERDLRELKAQYTRIFLLWVGDLASNINESQGDCFYFQMACLASCYLTIDADALGRILSDSEEQKVCLKTKSQA